MTETEKTTISASDKSRLLLSMSADEFGLSRHYEALQYSILGASIATSALTINFGSHLGAYPRYYEIAARIAIGFLLFALMALTFRCSALSVLSFHSGMHYRIKANEIISGALPECGKYPFDRDFRDPKFIELSPFVIPTILLASRPIFLYSTVLLTFAFGVAALILTANHAPAG